MDVQIVASLLGGLVSGLFTFLGVFLTISYQRKKDADEEKRKQKEKEEEINDARPRLEIQEFFAIEDEKNEQEPDISAIIASIKGFENTDRARFKYNPYLLETEKWVAVDYVLKNIGATEVDHLYLMTNLPRNTSIFNVTSGEYKDDFKYQFLNYSVILEKTIKPQQTVKIRIYYLENEVIVSNMGSAMISIWLMDINNRVWLQPLFAPHNKIYNSKKKTWKDFQSDNNIETAIKCFINPMLW